MFSAPSLNLIRGGWREVDGLIVMHGMESMERYQTHGNQAFDVFETIPFIPFQLLL
jgi:hypothetical protein